MTLNNFMLAAGDLRLRGTGSVLRFTKNLREYLGGKGYVLMATRMITLIIDETLSKHWEFV